LLGGSLALSSRYAALERGLAYTFRAQELLRRALTHRSKGADNYERLEFLGDSVLNFVIAARLYELFSELSEGELTRLRARLVRMETLAGLARNLDLGNSLELGSGELKSGGYDRDSILSDALEAVFGAIYVESGFAVVRTAILHLYHDTLADIDPRQVDKDPKTRLQEYLQKHALNTPTYSVLEMTGEPHVQTFVVMCQVPGLDQVVRGTGNSRRAAEQQAAARAYALLMGQTNE
jgi:ribonuclease III